MADFIKDSSINAELENIFEKAKEQLIIVSPFIKLHSRLINILKSKKDNHELKITIVFGKNEDNLSKSFNKNEFDFLKDFPNIEIKYESRLHAKYYANESAALLSSMNLYDFSQNNNIEFGILTKATIIGALTGNLFGDKIDNEAFSYFEQIIKNSETLYKRTPFYDEKLLGLTKKYSHSDVEIDKLSQTLEIKSTTESKQINEDNHVGYCIRTGVKIPFNPKKPLSDAAYKSWNKHKNKNFKETYCHYSGEPSYGETSFAKPILNKNWKKAMEK